MRDKQTQWVLVECVSTFHRRYMVETPKDKDLWALDTVTMNQAKEFSQKHIGEQIITHRVVSEKTALELCDQDNLYAQAWSRPKKLEVFFSTLQDQELYNEH